MELSYVHRASSKRCQCFEYNGHNPCSGMVNTTYGSGPYQGQTLHEIFNWDYRLQPVEIGMMVARDQQGRLKAFHRGTFLTEFTPAFYLS